MDPLDDLFDDIFHTKTTAVILAGGQGTRMRPYDGPKATVPIAGKPLIARLMDHLKKQVSGFHVCLGYKADDVKRAAKDSWDGADNELTFSDAGEHATMAERLELAFTEVQTPHLLVCYGDTLANVDVDELRKEMERNEAAMVVSTTQLKSEFGVVRTTAKRVDKDLSHHLIKVEEKPTLQEFISIGYILCHHWTGLQLNVRWNVVDWLNAIAAQDKVVAYRHPGWHYTINNEYDLVKVNECFGRLRQ